MIEAKNLNEFVKNIKRTKVVLVDFYADWCTPCKKLTPILEELQNEFKDFSVVKVNVENDDVNEIVVDNNVSAMPTLMFYKNGQDINKNLIGLQTKETLKKVILELIED